MRLTEVFGFRGMSNLPTASRHVLDPETRTIQPRIIKNAYVAHHKLYLRPGFAKELTFTQGHSLWAGSVLLAADGNTLYRITGTTREALAEIAGPVQPLCYWEDQNTVYISNPSWNAKYDLLSGTLSTWGQALPPAPAVSLTSGNLPAGRYLLCYTDAGSGNGPVIQIRWEGGARGLLLNNRSGRQAWITQPNGKTFFAAPLSGETITGLTPKMQPLDSFGVFPCPGFSHFFIGFDRVWGIRGDTIYFSDAFLYNWFRPQNYLPFLEELLFLAPVKDGFFVTSQRHTWFLHGREVAKLKPTRIGDGAVPGTLTYAMVEGSGYEISRQYSQLPSPVWMDPRGIVVGTQTGHLVHLTEAKAHLTPRQFGAAYYWQQEGLSQIIITLWGSKNQTSNLDTAFAT